MPAAITPIPPPERIAPARLQPSLEQVTFDQAVQRAIAHGVSSRVAAQEVLRAEGLLWQARSASLPTLTANGAYARLDGDRYSGTTVVVPRGQTTGNVALVVPLIAPSRWYLWSHGSDAVDVARAGEQDTRRTAALTAARAYLNIIAQRRALAVFVRARDNARVHYEFAHKREVSGLGNALDALRASQQLAVNESQVEQAYAALAQAREVLGIVLGADGPVDAAEDPELPVPTDPDQALHTAETVRQDVVASRTRAVAAGRVARDSWSDWLPTIFATAQPNYQHPPSTPNPETGWQAALVLSWPLFEGGLRVGQARERGALAREADLSLDLALRTARSDVRTAWESMLRADSAFRSSKRAAEAADAVLAMVTRAFQAGTLTSLDLNDAERQARDADAAAVVAEDTVRQTRVNLLAAAGRFP
jgi:outer membrane protein TolC